MWADLKNGLMKVAIVIDFYVLQKLQSFCHLIPKDFLISPAIPFQ